MVKLPKKTSILLILLLSLKVHGQVVCSPDCVNGACTAAPNAGDPNTCTCDSGWEGPQCQNAVCSPECVNGDCTAPDTCTCNPGWEGPQCQNNPCTDEADCASANTDHCIFQSIVDACPLLCHEKSTTCNPTECNDKDICRGLNAAFCTNPDVVAECPLLCAAQSSCVPKECSDGFVNVNNQCLMFSSDRLTWSAAKTTCENLKGRLVVPTDFTKMVDYIIKNDLFDWQYWVGVSDQSDPGTYKWLDGTSVDSDLWYTGYPLTPGTAGVTKGQSCVKLHHSSNTNYGLVAAWDTNYDGIYTNRYICEELP